MVQNKVKKTIQTLKLLNIGDTVVVAVSGGSDSIGLLYLLNDLKKYNLKIIVVHVNHKLRGEESDEDESLVRKTATSLNLIYETVSTDTIAYKKKFKLSLEDSARQLRYAFFHKILDKYSADCIATAHTMNDQAETIIMRLIRGSGMLGLSGISPKENKVIRPLINLTKKEIQKYLISRAISWREDSSNLSDDYFRNSVRREIIPLLEKYNPSIQKTICRSAFVFGVENNFLDGVMEQKFNKISKELSSGIVFFGKVFLNEHKAIRFGVLRKAVQTLKGDTKNLFSKHLLQIEEVIHSTYSSGEVSLPDDLVFYKGHDLFFVGFKEKVGAKYDFNITELGSWKITEDLTVDVDITDDLTEFGEKNTAYLSVDKVDFPLQITSYKEGDRFIPLGMKGFKKIKNFFIDEKTPRFFRRKFPVFRSNGEIFWLGGMRIDERFKSQKDSKTFLKIKISGFIDEFDSLFTDNK